MSLSIIGHDTAHMTTNVLRNSRFLAILGATLFSFTTHVVSGSLDRARRDNPCGPNLCGYGICCAGGTCCNGYTYGTCQGDNPCWYVCDGIHYYRCCDCIDGCICRIYIGQC